DSNVEFHAFVLRQMAAAQISVGEYQAAETAARDALHKLVSAGKGQTGTFAVAEGVLADSLRAEGNYNEAKCLAEAALKLANETLKSLPAQVGILLTTLGQTLLESGEISRAGEVCRRAIVAFSQTGDQETIELGSAYQNLAVVYAQQGKPKRAL